MGQTFGGFPLHGPKLVRQYRAHYGRSFIAELARANAIYVPSGRWPAQAWLLLRFADYQQIDPYSTSLELQIDDFVHGPVTFKHLTVVQARCVSTGVTNDPNTIYLVQATDKRGVLYNPWVRKGTTSQYNIRAPAYPGEYYSGTLNGGVPWTWSTMIAHLWGQLPLLGSWPGLPILPTGSPEGWSFPGCSVWEALNAVLDQQGMTIAVNLSSDRPYTIVQCGAADADFEAFQAANLPEDDLAYQDTGSGRVPGVVLVLFHRRNEFYGTEETVRRDSLQWQTSPLHEVTVTATQAGFPGFAASAGVHEIWADFSVRYDVDGNPLAADVTTAQTIAVEQAAAYYNLTRRATQGFMRKVFTGAQALGTSGEVDGIRWFQTMADPARSAWRMECVRGYVWPEIQFDKQAMGLMGE